MGIDGQKKTILWFTQIVSVVLWILACYVNQLRWNKELASTIVISSVLYACPIVLSVFRFWLINSRYSQDEYVERYNAQAKTKISDIDANKKFQKLKRIINVFTVLGFTTVFLSLISFILSYVSAVNILPNFIPNYVVKYLVLANYVILLFLSLYEKGCSADSKHVLLKS